jgi:hypothetical protein
VVVVADEVAGLANFETVAMAASARPAVSGVATSLLLYGNQNGATITIIWVSPAQGTTIDRI